MFIRSEYQEVKSRLEEPRMFIQVISGPRQVGKSTLVEQVLDGITIPHNSYSADAELDASQAWISNVWDAARNEMDFRKETERVLVIDEIQKIKNWSEIVKKNGTEILGKKEISKYSCSAHPDCLSNKV